MNNLSRCLVLGGKGFLGSHLVDALLDRGQQVRVFDRPNVMFPSAAPISRSRLEVFEGDFASDADTAAAVVGCDICYHLVSTTLPKSSNADPLFDIETNLLGSVRLLNHAVRNGVKKIVFVSSGGTVYGKTLRLPVEEGHPTNPISSYGITKLAIEKYLGLFLELHGLEYSVVRLSNPYGERQRTHASQGVIAVFLGKVLRGEVLEIWGDGSVVRDYVYIADVIRALLAAADYQGDERILNIGSGEGKSLNEIMDVIGQVTGKDVMRTYVKARSFDVPASVLSISRASNALNWRPEVPLVEGVKRTATWIMSQPSSEL